MTHEHDDGDYVLRWPRTLFKAETAKLLNNRSKLGNWSDRCSILLEDAFTSTTPRDDFESANARVAAWGETPKLDEGQKFLVSLLREADTFRELGVRPPYWSQRRAGADSAELKLTTAAHEFTRLVTELEDRGYFEKSFGKDCVDDPSDIDPAEVIASHLGVRELWPLPTRHLADDRDQFLDVVEVLHDLVAFPRSRSPHSYGNCGWHHGDFSPSAGQAVYRWSVNRILDRTPLGVRLADEGEDRGRLVAVTDDARTELAHRMALRSDPGTGDVVRHALALYRARGATEHERRSAVITLAGVLEQRRDQLKAELARKDEGVLFRIANEFAIRHQGDTQKSDYDPVFLDWIFYWYLATIDLTDRLLARQSGPDPSPVNY